MGVRNLLGWPINFYRSGSNMVGTMLGVVAAFAFLMVQDVSADVCTDNMIYMDLCVQWKDMCAQSKFLQDKCSRTCGTCAPVNCTWADWGNFTQCTESCGGGFKTRSRVIASPPLYGRLPVKEMLSNPLLVMSNL